MYQYLIVLKSFVAAAEAGGPAAMAEVVAAGTAVTAEEVAAETAAAGEPADMAVGAVVAMEVVAAMVVVVAAASSGIPVISCVTWFGPSTPSPSLRRISTRPPRAS